MTLMASEHPRPGVPDWRESAACRGMDPDVFFPPRGDVRRVKAAKRVCEACPVRRECLDDAIVTGEWAGVRGGLSGGERRQIRAERSA